MNEDITTLLIYPIKDLAKARTLSEPKEERKP
jgi:hypothetical protein